MLGRKKYLVTIVAVLVHAHQIAVWNIQNVKYDIKIFIAALFGIIYFVNICIYILTYFLCKEQYSLLELQLPRKSDGRSHEQRFRIHE